MFDIFLLQISLFIHWSLAFTVRDLCVCVWLVSGQYTHMSMSAYFSVMTRVKIEHTFPKNRQNSSLLNRSDISC